MAFCRHCGQKLVDGDKFCGGCGKPTVGSSESEGRKTSYDGEIHKCPNCGELLKSFETKCPVCGYELRGIKSTGSVLEFVAKLEAIEKKKSTWRWSSGNTANNSKNPFEEEEIALITNFPIPNTKEDILEFVVLAASHIDLKEKNSNTNKVMLAWKEKLEQAHYKAKISFGGSSDFQKVEQIYQEEIVKPKKKKFIKIISIIGAVALIFIIQILVTDINFSGGCSGESTIFEWQDIEMNQLLPEPTNQYGEVIANSQEYLSIYIHKITQNDYKNYVAKCKENGFTIDAETDTSSYEAYNTDGYKLRIYYSDWNNEYHISLDDPVKQNEIKWEAVKIMEYLPTPLSTIGEISYEYADSFSVYILNTTREDYASYVNSCIETGFNVDYSKYESSFYADDKNGYSLTLRYEGYNTMYLYVRM